MSRPGTDYVNIHQFYDHLVNIGIELDQREKDVILKEYRKVGQRK